MSDSELIYELEADPPAAEKFFAALQHVLASFVGIITPTLIIGGVLGLGDHVPYLISMALMVSGVGTIIQAKKPMNIGAGMICIQGTSFAFLSSVLAAGFIAKKIKLIRMSEELTVSPEELLEELTLALTQENFVELEEIAEEAIELYPQAAWGYYYMGEALLLQFNEHAALNQFNRAVELDSENLDYQNCQALCLSKLGEEEKAQKYCKYFFQ